VAEVPLPGAFEEQVLVALVHGQPDAYGMTVRRELEARTGRNVSIGAVYATLDRLEAKGWVSSRTTEIGGQSRRTFVLEDAGARVLREALRLRDRLWDGIEPGRLGPAG
jgi:PadR family transcriptional regulator PadR